MLSPGYVLPEAETFTNLTTFCGFWLTTVIDGSEVNPDNSDEYTSNIFAKLILDIPAEILVRLFTLSIFNVVVPWLRTNFGFFVVSNEVAIPLISLYVIP